MTWTRVRGSSRFDWSFARTTMFYRRGGRMQFSREWWWNKNFAHDNRKPNRTNISERWSRWTVKQERNFMTIKCWWDRPSNAVESFPIAVVVCTYRGLNKSFKPNVTFSEDKERSNASKHKVPYWPPSIDCCKLDWCARSIIRNTVGGGGCNDFKNIRRRLILNLVLHCTMIYSMFVGLKRKSISVQFCDDYLIF